jgi:Flp pilus assembly protein TadB
VTLLIAPAAAVLGLIATFVVIRARSREKESLYETLRAERQKQIQQARLRAMGNTDTAGTRPPAPAEPVEAVETSRPEDPRSELAELRAQRIHRDRLSNVTGIIALVVSLVLVLLGVLLAVAQTHGP